MSWPKTLESPLNAPACRVARTIGESMITGYGGLETRIVVIAQRRESGRLMQMMMKPFDGIEGRCEAQQPLERVAFLF